jgi:hypothetical protein
MLQEGDICLIVRPLMSDNIASNTRVKVCRIAQRYIVVATLDDVPKSFILPRMRFRFTSTRNRRQFTLLRTQFPLRLAYAITCNKSQGQTLNKVLLDMRTWCFAHGHLYVALSRVRSHLNIRLFHAEDDDHFMAHDDRIVPTVYNVIHRSVIDCIPWTHLSTLLFFETLFLAEQWNTFPVFVYST